MNSLKQSFNYIASSYEKYRPNYPNEMFTDIMQYANLDRNDSLLEIGCGTGKATEGFLNMGYENITCIEYGENLAKLTKEKFLNYPDVHVIHSPFEGWESKDALYSLAFSGTAFHFIPAQIGYPKAASCLKEDGVIAFFWFEHVSSEEPVYQEISAIYKKHAPHLDDRDVPAVEEVIENRSLQTTESEHFHQLKVHTYKWEQLYKPEEYIGLLNTHSGHQVLPVEQKQALYDGIEEVIMKHGGQITKQHVVALYLARKK
ncbi:class I SAM-dependent methyltransferase [Bacillus sp. NEB1478]|uniref:class I SAM-dependent methyltransferase n=1 Tax=Bacillus sp. NEB1478 TaxID=3073816 RepID=UPI0028730A8C|nr:class I SAM-dependent methyltransferase [Bacillus sp. NEB1478]WNB91289.1 class I SAM-dependent methyltransferase [Bacillus sp. NEB1478]